jgi:cysteine desulfurase
MTAGIVDLMNLLAGPACHPRKEMRTGRGWAWNCRYIESNPQTQLFRDFSLSASLYLDHAATTPLLPAARDALLEGLALWANPSSPHRAGRCARGAGRRAARIKAALGWPARWCSPAARARRWPWRSAGPRRRWWRSAVEHEAVLRLAGAARLAVDARAGRSGECALAGWSAVQQVNNETGVIQPLADRRACAGGGVLLADAAQGRASWPCPMPI